MQYCVAPVAVERRGRHLSALTVILPGDVIFRRYTRDCPVISNDLAR